MSVPPPDFARWLIASIGSGLAAVDAAGAVAALNAEAQRILGCPSGPRGQALGRDCGEVFARQPTVARLLRDALDGRDRPSRAELVLEPCADRPPLTIGFTLLAVRDEASAVRGAALMFRDLGPYQRTHEEDRLRDRLAVLGEMAAGLAHEIRNPLAGMEVLTGLLQRRLASGSEERELVDELGTELRRLAGTVTASLEFVRPVAPRLEVADPIALIEEALARAHARVEYAGKVERDYAEGLPPTPLDADGLRGVLTNLILNALEAMAATPREADHILRLGLRVESGARAMRPVRVDGRGVPVAEPASPPPELVWSVGDTGTGVPDDLQERIFYPFFSTKPLGCGIGLANAQKLVAAHGGRIELESRSGAGATFRVRLPLAPEVGT